MSDHVKHSGAELRGAFRRALAAFLPFEERRAEWEERAALLEFDGGLARPEAERRATEETGFDPAEGRPGGQAGEMGPEGPEGD